jgi:glycosyltransferase 2 family protein
VKKVFWLLGWAALGVSIVYVSFEINRNFEELPSVDWSISSLSAVLAAISAYSYSVAVWSFGWAVMLRGLGEKISNSSAFLIVGISQITKYVPGNVAHHVGRVALARNDDLAVSRVTASMFLEFCLLAAASGSCALIVLGISGAQSIYEQHDFGVVSILAIIISALLMPLCVAFAFQRQVPGFLFKRFPAGHLNSPALIVYAVNFLTHLHNFLLHGAIIVVLGLGVFGFESIDFWLMVGVFSLAWLAGFVAPGAPAGLGIRDAILVVGLSLNHSVADAIALAAFHRMTTVAGDVVVFLIALGLRRRKAQAGRKRES